MKRNLNDDGEGAKGKGYAAFQKILAHQVRQTPDQNTFKHVRPDCAVDRPPPMRDRSSLAALDPA